MTPETIFVSKFDKKLPKVTYPCILKKPDSAFTHGVFKLNTEDELKQSLNQFFKTSDLILLQPFIPTEFDWRIGILDNKPLYACRYYMPRDYWEHTEEESISAQEGRSEAIPLKDVPEAVIKTALKATRLIGDSLYGIDIKCHKNKLYVMEINDNPKIDNGIEDEILGENLYQQVMNVFLQRIRRKHGYA